MSCFTAPSQTLNLNMIFVDTSAWYAAIIPSDENHKAVSEWLNENTEPLITTDYIVDETLTLLRARGESKRALLMGERFFESKMVEVYLLTEGDLIETWKVFRRYDDKEWSFTDCSSKIVMEALGVTKALAIDRHFIQFGSIEVLP